MALRAGDPESIGGYALERRLGRGGMGTVYLARSPSGRRLALKVVHQQFADDDEFRVRFRQEVAAARRVSGAFTAAVVDADPDAVLPWMATSYVPGRTLAERVAAGGPLRGAELRRLAIGLVEALRDIHRAGVVHRDLKPANIVLSDEGPRVIDFGISRAADHQTLTMTGRVMGTPPFMSPEQLRDPREVGPESDVFSLATVLVYAATGQSPFDADSPYMTAYHVVYEPPALDAVTGPLRDAVADCLSKDAPARPGLDELLERLRTLPEDDGDDSKGGDDDRKDVTDADGGTGEGDEGDAAVPTEVGRAPGRGYLTRRPLVIAAAAAGLVAAMVGTVVFLRAGSGPGGEPDARPTTRSSGNGSLPSGWRPWQRTLAGPDADIVTSANGAPRSVSGPTGRRCLPSGTDLYCGGSGIALTRLDVRGRVAWHRSAKPSELIGVAGGLVLGTVEKSDGTARLEGYRTSDGERVWRTDVGSAYQGAVFQRGDHPAVLTQSWDQETFQAVDVRTGRTLWSRRVGHGLTCGPDVVAGRPLADCGPLEDRGDPAVPSGLYTLSPTTGAPRRIGTVYVGSFLAERSGDLLYLEQREHDTDDYTDLLFLGTDGGRQRRVKLPEGLSAQQITPALVGDTLYFVRQNGEVTAVTTAGKRLWGKATQVEWLGPPVVSGRRNALYLATAAGRVVALDRRDGRVLWRTKARTDPGGIPAELTLSGDALTTVYGYDTLEASGMDVSRGG
ncbi:protein kinase domain-containing protein [Streptomyces iranensis]|uniref:Serine/threonine protein kinase n=1 Tax=Streptomyces iranensis TaxID=576784 RepID=A0A060ZXM5_9ACTN|nr:serine/threonine-protein kinase [Streptomyces iranensis]MBP2068025.1 serine/threonine protein kinase [Streptomyces iranensis]CDR07914.1 serine/threonine protein kinase [Streptomyces iranensis]